RPQSRLIPPIRVVNSTCTGQRPCSSATVGAPVLAFNLDPTKTFRRKPGSRLNVRPGPQQVVIDTGQIHQRTLVRRVRGDLLNGAVELEQEAPPAIRAHHALYPEKCREPDAPRHRLDMMHARSGIEHHV